MDTVSQSALEDRRLWFRTKILPHTTELTLYARRYARSLPVDAEDLVQEAFAKIIVYEGWLTVENPAAFAIQVLRNIALDALRRQKVVRIDAVADLDAVTLGDDSPTAEQTVIARDELRRLGRIIAELPTQCRRVFTLRKIYEMSNAEIAKRLGLSVSTVETHLLRGMKICERKMASTDQPLGEPAKARSWVKMRVRKETA